MTPSEKAKVNALIKSYNSYIESLSKETYLLRKKVKELYEDCEVRSNHIDEQNKCRGSLAKALEPFINKTTP